VLFGFLAVICSVFGLPSLNFLETAIQQSGGVGGFGAINTTSLTINSGPSRESTLVLGDTSSNSAFTVALTSEGSFEIRFQGQSAFTVGPDGQVTVNGKITSSGVVRIGQTLNFAGVSQWMLALSETFTIGGSGWTNSSVSTCGSPDKPILGGYGVFAGGEVSKQYQQLPAHNQIRFKATFHFIDGWTGETAYLKLDHQVVWTDMHDYMTSKNGINICGSASAAESKFAVPIDVVIPHTASSMAVTFVSTLKTSKRSVH